MGSFRLAELAAATALAVMLLSLAAEAAEARPAGTTPLCGDPLDLHPHPLADGRHPPATVIARL